MNLIKDFLQLFYYFSFIKKELSIKIIISISALFMDGINNHLDYRRVE